MSRFTLFFDEQRPALGNLHFERDRAKQPDKSNFTIVEFVPMSSAVGERWALVTLKNTASSHRILKEDHLMAVLANGKQVFARNLDHRLEGSAQYTQAINFGFHPFPIIKLETRCDCNRHGAKKHMPVGGDSVP